MGERNYELGPGAIFINGEPLACVEVGVATEEMADEVQQVISYDLANEASFTGYFKLGRTNGKSELAVWHMLMGIEKRIIALCPNKRVVYLAYHAKKQRARDKNYKRMCRIVEKLGESNDQN